MAEGRNPGTLSIRQRWFWIMPNVAVVLFILAMVGLLWILHKHELEQQRNSLIRDTRWADQTIRLHLLANQEALFQLANDLAQESLETDAFLVRASQHMANSPELINIVAFSENGVIRWAAPFETTARLVGEPLGSDAAQVAFRQARASGKATYSRPFAGEDKDVNIEVHVPVFRNKAFAGTITGVYSVRGILNHLVPSWFSDKYQLRIAGSDGNLLAFSAGDQPGGDMVHEIPFDPPGHGLMLRAASYKTQSGLAQKMLVALIVGLSAVIIWSLWALRQHIFQRVQVEKERDRLFNLSLDMLCVVSLDGSFRRTNPAFERILGHPESRLRATYFIEMVFPDDRATTQAKLRKLAIGQPTTDFENRFRCADGSYRWLVWTANPVVEEGVFYAVGHDITGRRQAEDALRAGYTFRKAMEDSILTGMRAIDMEGRIIYVNAAFCKMVGYNQEELIGTRPPFPYWSPDDIDAHDRDIELILEGKIPSTGFESRFRRRNGEHFYARLFVSPLIDGSGVQTGWMASMVDVTESKIARAALQASHEQFVTVLDGLDAAVYVADLQNNELLFVNRYFKNIYGADALGRNCWDVTRHCQLNPTTFADFGAALAPAEVPVDLFDDEVQNRSNGRWYHVRDRAIKWVDGRVVRMEIATDITDRKHMVEVTRQQQKRIEQTSGLIAMGEMASTIAHELNQPLAAITNYNMACVNKLMADNFRKEDLLTTMQKAGAQAERAGKIIRRVRDFVRKSEPQRTPSDLRELLEEAASFADIEARRNSVRIRLDVPASLPLVSVDRIMIEQVILNLLKNGIEALQGMARDRRELRVGACIRDDRAVEVTVSDSGHGIPAEHMEKLFVPFFTTKASGMGMGLNICRSIIEFHDGRLWASPNPGGGSIFHFTLATEN